MSANNVTTKNTTNRFLLDEERSALAVYFESSRALSTAVVFLEKDPLPNYGRFLELFFNEVSQ